MDAMMNLLRKIQTGLAAACIFISVAGAQPVPSIDFDRNGVVDDRDFHLLVSEFGTEQARFDLNGDGEVNFQDFLVFVRLYSNARQVAAEVVVEQIAGRVDVFSVPTLGSQVHDIVVDAQGRVWFTEIGVNQIGRFDPRTETFVEYPLPTPGGQPHRLAVDAQGKIWFTEIGANKIGRFDPVSEEIREFLVPTPGSRPHSLVFDQKGRLWFTQESGNRIARLDPNTNTFEAFVLFTPAAGLDGLQVGKDGVLVFLERAAGNLGRLNPETGEIVEIRLPVEGLVPRQFVLDAGGKVWFTADPAGLYMWDLDSGRFTSYRVPDEVQTPYAITVDLNDRIWFAGRKSKYIVRFDPKSLHFRLYTLPVPASGVGHLTVDRLGQVWFTDPDRNRIGKVEDIGP